jgi:hypothetical protein
MFERVARLGDELDNLAVKAQSSGNTDLTRDVARFVVAVAEEVSQAFSDFHETLREIAFLAPGDLSADKITQLQKDLTATYAKDKFKNVLRICDRLNELAHDYKVRIEPNIPGAAGGPSSQLFWLLEKHEGAFIYTIRNAVDQINKILDQYRDGAGIDEARARARAALKELQQSLEQVTKAQNQVLGSLPGGTSMLLDSGRIADEVLRRSPWFSGSFYLGSALILLTALTIVAGHVPILTFPLVLAGTFAGMTIIGAFQLQNDRRLSEKSFVQLVDLALRRVLLPISKKRLG